MASKNKIASVTGGSRGLGKNMSIRLPEKGHDVILTYQSQKDAAERVVKDIEAMGRQGIALRLDVSDFMSLDGFIELLAQTLQSKWDTAHLDFMINNAGIGATIPFEKVTEEDFDTFLNIHFKSVYFLTQKALPMINDQGQIINISTGTTRFCVPGYSVYASMKGAIETFTKYLAKEVGSRGITANVVAPGPIETDFNNAAIRNNPERNAAMGAMTALGRVGAADDIGGGDSFPLLRRCTMDNRPKN